MTPILREESIGGMGSSVYLSTCHRYHGILAPDANCPVYKLTVPSASSSSSSSPVASSSATTTSCNRERVAELEIDAENMSFVASPSKAGWIIGVGGYAGRTIILDTTTKPKPTTIRGPDMLAAKCGPILAAVGHKVYALCNCPNYIDEPNFVPWFEVLDLSKCTVVTVTDERGTSHRRLEGCVWEALPCPPCFPGKLSPTGYLHPPIISVRSYVVVAPYMLLSLNQTRVDSIYVFDTGSGDWHKINKSLPFVGRATPLHGHSKCVFFLGTSLWNWSVNAYRISVSSDSSGSSYPYSPTLLGKGGASNSAGGNGKGSAAATTALRLSIAEYPIRSKNKERLGTTAGQAIVSLDGERFSLLTFSLGDRKRSSRMSCYYGHHDDDEFDYHSYYSAKLVAKFTTYRIEDPALLEDEEKLQAVKYVVAACKQMEEQSFEFSGSFGFTSSPIPFALSI